MNGLVLHRVPIAVDYWTRRSNARLHFLSHMHSDHTAGLTASWPRPIYCSVVSKLLLIKQFKIPANLIRGLTLNEPHIVQLDDDETLTVTLIDARHCPGACMFLFEGSFGRILYTGDFRFSPSMVDDPCFATYCARKNIDELYIDNTFCSPKCNFPSRKTATKEIIEITRAHPEHRVLVGMRSLGKESMLVDIATELRTHVYVSEEDRYRHFELLGLPNVFTMDASESRIHVVNQQTLSEPSVAALNVEMKTIAIIPTGLYMALGESVKSRDVFVVNYSDHSSFAELCLFVKSVRPRLVYPILTSRTRDRIFQAMPERVDMSCFEDFLDKSPIESDHQSTRVISCNKDVRVGLTSTSNLCNGQINADLKKSSNRKRVRPLRRKPSTTKGFEYISSQPSLSENLEAYENIPKNSGDAFKYDDAEPGVNEPGVNVSSVPASNVLTPAKILSPSKTLSPTKILSPSLRGILPPAKVLSPAETLPPAKIISPSKALPPGNLLSPSTISPPSKLSSLTKPASPSTFTQLSPSRRLFTATSEMLPPPKALIHLASSVKHVNPIPSTLVEFSENLVSPPIKLISTESETSTVATACPEMCRKSGIRGPSDLERLHEQQLSVISDLVEEERLKYIRTEEIVKRYRETSNIRN